MKIIIEVKECEGTTKEEAEIYLKEFLRHLNKWGKYNFWNWKESKITIE